MAIGEPTMWAQIIAAAYRAIARQGVAAITTRTLAGEAGVNLATLHALLGGKDALLMAVLEQIGRHSMPHQPHADESELCHANAPAF